MRTLVPGRARHRRVSLATASSTLATVAVLTAGCGGSGGSGSVSAKRSAADFVSRITVEFSRGQSGRLWDELLPADQAVVTRARYMECERNEGWDLKKIKVIETYDDTIAIGTKSVPSTAVTLRVTSADGVTTATMHTVSVNGKWRWILQPGDRAAYRTGKCPSSG